MGDRCLSDGFGGNFAMVPLGSDGPALDALKAGELQARDFSVLWALLMHMNWRNGRAEVSAAELAASLGHDRADHTLQSLARLRRAGVIARSVSMGDRSRRFYCFHPEVALSGGPRRRFMQMESFFDAAELDRHEWMKFRAQRQAQAEARAAARQADASAPGAALPGSVPHPLNGSPLV